jgi:hypothetical protein
MNAVEIEEAISALAEQPFDAEDFPFAFLLAFGNKATTIKRLQSGSSNKSDQGGVLQTNNIHLKVCGAGEVTSTLAQLKASPATTKAKAKFVLATDGTDLEAEDLTTGETIACAYTDFPDHFGFFLPLAGISTVKQIRESAFDIKATGRLNRLYVELLKDNPEWGTAVRRHDMNHFMARLIFCFFAEDTDIFTEPDQFTGTIERMSERDSSNTDEVISELFRAMNTKADDRTAAGVARWASVFPYVNGGLFSGTADVPRFSKIARSYLIHIGSLDWTKINPDIFGSMIQAVADDEERGALGMHYTSVPNILKVLNPLFLDDLRERLEEAGDNPRKLMNLRGRIAKIRVFDPACGSGNFLVIAYKEMRAIEAVINDRRDEADRRTDIPITNYRGIELRSFSAEIARLALIIAEYQCDVTYRGQKEALAEFLPLDAQNWITCGNALRLDWLSICPPTGTVVKLQSEDLFMSPSDQAHIDFENEGGETYICGNPPYVWSNQQSKDQKRDLELIFKGRSKTWKSLDYVSGWFMKAAEYSQHTFCSSAFVSTNSICQGQQVAMLWPAIFNTGSQIAFAHTGFKWSNLASKNAGVTVIIVGLSRHDTGTKHLFSIDEKGHEVRALPENINAYLTPGADVIIKKESKSISGLSEMRFGNKAVDGGHLILSEDGLDSLNLKPEDKFRLTRKFYGSAEFIKGLARFCLWIKDKDLVEAKKYPAIEQRIESVRKIRSGSRDIGAKAMASRSHQFREMYAAEEQLLVIPRVSSEGRPYLPVGILGSDSVIGDRNFAIYDGPTWNMSIIGSRMHWVWIGTVCGKLETRFLYSNTLGWNTFPVPKLTEKNKADLTACAEDMLLAREAHFPATIADLYNPETMPENLRAAHARNDEVLERIYIGRRFRNDTERLEKLFELYTKMTTKVRAA